MYTVALVWLLLVWAKTNAVNFEREKKNFPFVVTVVVIALVLYVVVLTVAVIRLINGYIPSLSGWGF